ncbi:transcription repressor NadR [Fusobacterium simiae]|uniref:Transcription repressor NadR n=1 Tax=Fusobacterium simiae TaxID=855 RepID=A0ABT4DKW7_FUSSI|nr:MULTISPECIES: transcription repressor NadR [Fusobacterium]MCY7008628.1 transcription repressor NadR [Fusobacterium simiae]MDC7955138.1 transcription repressor NadR [Fusobacterium simiae]
MIEREEREKKILEILRNSKTLVSGTYLAEFFNVSRQVIVQDIAILKAKNIDIISTNRGYRLFSKGIKKIIKVKHDDLEIKNELNAIVDLGANVEDVFVIHKTYGKIRVKLDIKSRRDVELLVENINSKLSRPLKNLTDNCHYHTIIAEDEKILNEVEDKLKELGILVEE